MNMNVLDLHQGTQGFSETARGFILGLIEKISKDGRVSAVLMAGSPLVCSVDRWSDVDLSFVCTDDTYAGVMAERIAFASNLGPLLSAFTGEHVGEPRLLICLYGEPLLHVDIKFIRVEDINPRVENPLVLWDRTGEATEMLKIGHPEWPNAELDWFEDRAWIWLHYGLAKVGRGEFFEALNMLSFFREQVLGPLVAKSSGKDQRGVRHLHKYVHLREELHRTIAGLNRESLLDAYQGSIDLYQQLYEVIAGTRNSHPASVPVRNYLSMVRMDEPELGA